MHEYVGLRSTVHANVLLIKNFERILHQTLHINAFILFNSIFHLLSLQKSFEL